MPPPEGTQLLLKALPNGSEVHQHLRQGNYAGYTVRGKQMKRAPKKEFYYPGHADALYLWGQDTVSRPGGEQYTGQPMPPWMVEIADGIRRQHDEEVNHAIVIEYSDGRVHFAPPHKDKLPPGTGFFVYSFGEPRCFQLLGEPTGKKDKKNVHEPQDVVWSRALPSNSLLVVSAEANRTMWHAVPQDKDWTGNARYSLIFRTITKKVDLGAASTKRVRGMLPRRE